MFYNGSNPRRCHGLRVACPFGAEKLRLTLRVGIAARVTARVTARVRARVRARVGARVGPETGGFSELLRVPEHEHWTTAPKMVHFDSGSRAFSCTDL